MFSIETRPLRQQNPFLNFHEEMSLVTEISAILVSPSFGGKAAENAGKFESVTGIKILKRDRYFSEKILCRFCVPVQARYV